jgi:hypothetical protein
MAEKIERRAPRREHFAARNGLDRWRIAALVEAL